MLCYHHIEGEEEDIFICQYKVYEVRKCEGAVDGQVGNTTVLSHVPYRSGRKWRRTGPPLLFAGANKGMSVSEHTYTSKYASVGIPQL